VTRLRKLFTVAAVALSLAAGTAFAQSEKAKKQAEIKKVAPTTQGSPQFVPPAERIATFDHHGTLWAEQPMYSQVNGPDWQFLV